MHKFNSRFTFEADGGFDKTGLQILEGLATIVSNHGNDISGGGGSNQDINIGDGKFGSGGAVGGF